MFKGVISLALFYALKDQKYKSFKVKLEQYEVQLNWSISVSIIIKLFVPVQYSHKPKVDEYWRNSNVQ